MSSGAAGLSEIVSNEYIANFYFLYIYTNKYIEEGRTSWLARCCISGLSDFVPFLLCGQKVLQSTSLDRRHQHHRTTIVMVLFSFQHKAIFRNSSHQDNELFHAAVVVGNFSSFQTSLNIAGKEWDSTCFSKCVNDFTSCTAWNRENLATTAIAFHWQGSL